VPTTLSGAEFSDLAGVTNPATQSKDLYTGRYIGAQVVILDPALTVHTPEWLWLSTGIRAIDHAMETICSRAPQPFTDATCLHSLTLLSAALRRVRAEPEDLDARLDCQLGVWLASTGLNRIPWGASHGIGHQLGAVANVPHGHCSCVLLPSVLRYNAPADTGQQALAARALEGADSSSADAVAELVTELGQPRTLARHRCPARPVSCNRRWCVAEHDGSQQPASDPRGHRRAGNPRNGVLIGQSARYHD
jgi:alcohol dehydrogenase class IV